MYTGGHAYFDHLLTEERFAPFHQGSSWFSLENEHWQLLGLDSAWDDHDRVGRAADVGPVQGHRRPAGPQDDPDQPPPALQRVRWSGSEKLEKPLRAGGVAETGRIDAWLWGDEHRCVVYEPQARVRHARLSATAGSPCTP